MRILIADKMSPAVVADLESLGASVAVRPGLASEALAEALGVCEVLIVRSTKVKAEAIAAAKSLALIVRAGAGVDTIDVAAASARGIYVANCPGKNADAVAELAIGLLIAADRRIVDATESLRQGAWKKKEFGQARGLKGRTLGVLGLGTIGRAVVRRAQGLEMDVLAWSRSLTPAQASALGVRCAASPLEVAKQADAVSVHVAASAETRHLVDRTFLEAMKPGTILVNTARGEIVDTEALRRAIAEKHLRVGLDVYEDEPAATAESFADTELAQAVTGTPHIGASTDQASEAIAEEAVRVVRVFKQTGVPANVVNICGRTPATYNLVVRHYNRVGVLAGVLDALREDGVNVEEMQNVIFADGKAACCTLQLDAAPSANALQAIASSEHVIQAGLQPREA